MTSKYSETFCLIWAQIMWDVGSNAAQGKGFRFGRGKGGRRSARHDRKEVPMTT